jgi:hypothetical protein
LYDGEARLTDVDRALVLSGLACFVLRGKRSPVERTTSVLVTKVGEFYSGTLFTLVDTVKAGGRCRTGNEK